MGDYSKELAGKAVIGHKVKQDPISKEAIETNEDYSNRVEPIRRGIFVPDKREKEFEEEIREFEGTFFGGKGMFGFERNMKKQD